jgi:phosphate uptake regulator
VAQFRKDLLALSDRALGVTEEAGKAESPSPEEIRRWGDQARDCNRRVRAIQEALERGDDPPEDLLDVVGDLSAALAELEEALAGGDIDRARDVEARLRDVQEALLREGA